MLHPSKKKKLFRCVNVWERCTQKCLVCYTCFEVLPEGVYVVQSADFFNYPFGEDDLRQAQARFLELLLEEDPDIRGITYATVEEAIANHKKDFSEL